MTFVQRLLAISQRLQLEGDSLNAFNLATAKNQHQEILEAWLQTVSDAHTSVEIARVYQDEYSRLLLEVAKDLGKIRKKLLANSLDLIHEIIEACITKISIIGAIASEKQLVYQFLQLELAVFAPRPFIKDSTLFNDMLKSTNIEEKLMPLTPRFSNESQLLSHNLISMFNAFKLVLATISSDEKVSLKQFSAYNEVVDSFILLKKKLLDEHFLEN